MNLNVNSECLSYDRIYVGFGVTEEQEQLIKSLVKLNGIIVMPLNDNVSLISSMIKIFYVLLILNLHLIQVNKIKKNI